MKHYVYIHFTKDSLVPFYIGKGINKRYLSKSNRNKYWNNIVNKHGFVSDILKYFNSHTEALNYEIEMIKFFKDEGFKLCNLTNGGEGHLGLKPSDLTKEKMSLAAKGKVFGKNNNAFKGSILAKNSITQEEILLNGTKDIEQSGFVNSCVYRCCSGERKSHKGFIFKRIDHE